MGWHWEHRIDTTFQDHLVLPPMEEVTREPPEQPPAPAPPAVADPAVPALVQPAIAPVVEPVVPPAVGIPERSVRARSRAQAPRKGASRSARSTSTSSAASTSSATSGATDCHLIAPAANSTVLKVALNPKRGPPPAESSTPSPRTKLGHHFWKLGQRLGFNP
jgi:hypothetical protein